MVEGKHWYQGDHSLFLLKERPALALTSERAFEIVAAVAHTPRDRPELVEPVRLARLAAALRDLLLELQLS